MSDPAPDFTTLTHYKVLAATPIGEGGQVLNQNFTTADGLQVQTDASITSLTSSIATKAAQSTVDALTTTVGTKATQTSVNTLASNLTTLTSTVATKADQSAVDNLADELSGKADVQYVDDAVSSKVENGVFNGFVSNIENEIAMKAAQSDVNAGFDNLTLLVNGKANIVHTHVIGQVTGLQAALDAKATGSLANYLTLNGNGSGLTGITSNQVGAYSTSQTDTLLLAKASAATVNSHIGNTSNPHSTTATQVGAYTTAQVDTLLAGKAATTSLADYLPLTGGTINGNVTVATGYTTSLGGTLVVNGQIQAQGGIAGYGGNLVGMNKGQVGLGNVQNVDQTNASNISSGTLNAARLPTLPYLKLDGSTTMTGNLAGTTASFSGDMTASSLTTGGIYGRYGNYSLTDTACSFQNLDITNLTIESNQLAFYDSLYVNDADIETNVISVCGMYGDEPGLNVLSGSFHAYGTATIDGTLNVNSNAAIHGDCGMNNFHFLVQNSIGQLSNGSVAIGLDYLTPTTFGLGLNVAGNAYSTSGGNTYVFRIDQSGNVNANGTVTAATVHTNRFEMQTGGVAGGMYASDNPYKKIVLENGSGFNEFTGYNGQVFAAQNGGTLATLDASGYVSNYPVTAPSFRGSAAALTSIPGAKGISYENPTAADNIGMFFADKAMTITKLSAVLRGGSSPSVTWSIRYAADRSATGTEVVTSGTTTTSTTTGSVVTSFSSGTIPAGSWVWLTTTAQSGSPTAMTVTLTQ